MPTYSELQAQIAELQRKAEELRKGERDEARAKILELMRTYDISVNELTSAAKTKSRPAMSVPAKYRDPSSGATWTGRGRAPLWLNGRNKEEFLIK